MLVDDLDLKRLLQYLLRGRSRCRPDRNGDGVIYPIPVVHARGERHDYPPVRQRHRVHPRHNELLAYGVALPDCEGQGVVRRVVGRIQIHSERYGRGLRRNRLQHKAVTAGHRIAAQARPFIELLNVAKGISQHEGLRLTVLDLEFYRAGCVIARRGSSRDDEFLVFRIGVSVCRQIRSMGAWGHRSIRPHSKRQSARSRSRFSSRSALPTHILASTDLALLVRFRRAIRG